MQVYFVQSATNSVMCSRKVALIVPLAPANRRRGVEPDWRTAGARWKREDDIPGDVYFRALEAAG